MFISSYFIFIEIEKLISLNNLTGSSSTQVEDDQ